MSAQSVLDATRCLEYHHFRGTRIIACCLTMVDGRAVVGFYDVPVTQTLDFSVGQQHARANAELAVAALLQGD